MKPQPTKQVSSVCNVLLTLLHCLLASHQYILSSKALIFGWVVITTLYHLMLQSWYKKNCLIIGEHVVIIFLTLKVTIATE